VLKELRVFKEILVLQVQIAMSLDQLDHRVLLDHKVQQGQLEQTLMSLVLLVQQGQLEQIVMLQVHKAQQGPLEQRDLTVLQDQQGQLDHKVQLVLQENKV